MPPRPSNRRRSDWTFNVERRGHPTTRPGDRDAIAAWFSGNLVDHWFTGEPEIVVDDYEILVVGELEPIEAADDQRAATEEARLERFRADTRPRRIEIAADAERRFARKVSWGARVGSTTKLFTTTSVPVMTRLHLTQRQILDTLVEAGVARSRSDALAWCVELVGRNETEWIARLRNALDGVAAARDEGPEAD